MTEESHRSSAAEIPVTSNGDLDQSPETVFVRVRARSETFENSIFQNYIIVSDSVFTGFKNKTLNRSSKPFV